MIFVEDGTSHNKYKLGVCTWQEVLPERQRLKCKELGEAFLKDMIFKTTL